MRLVRRASLRLCRREGHIFFLPNCKHQNTVFGRDSGLTSRLSVSPPHRFPRALVFGLPSHTPPDPVRAVCTWPFPPVLLLCPPFLHGDTRVDMSAALKKFKTGTVPPSTVGRRYVAVRQKPRSSSSDTRQKIELHTTRTEVFRTHVTQPDFAGSDDFICWRLARGVFAVMLYSYNMLYITYVAPPRACVYVCACTRMCWCCRICYVHTYTHTYI